MWKLLEVSDALGNIANVIESAPHEAEIGGPIYTALIDLLAVIMERWPKTRYSVGSRPKLREILFRCCSSVDDTAAHAALRSSTRIALCAGVIGLIRKDPRDAWLAIKNCLNSSKKCSIRVAALHLFALLGGFSAFSLLIDEQNLEFVSSCCVRALEDTWICYRRKQSTDMELLAIEAADAISVLLLQTGKHHIQFVRAGVLKVIFQILLCPCVSKEGNTSLESELDTMHDHDSQAINELPLFAKKQNPQFRIFLWETFGWLGAHCKGEAQELIKKDIEFAHAFNKLASFACNYVVRTVIRRGQRLTSPKDMHSRSLYREDQLDKSISIHISDQEAAQMCKTTLILLSSTSEYCSTTTKVLLDNQLQQYAEEPFTFLLDALGLGYKETSKVKSEKVLTLRRLWTLSSLSYLQESKRKLLDTNGANVVFIIIREHHKANVRTTFGNSSLPISGVHGRIMESKSCKSCCSHVIQKWEGDDDVLFAALSAFARLFQGSVWAKELTGIVQQGSVYQLVKNQHGEGEVISLLWKLAGDKDAAAGVRWWASSGLACLGLYGFPSKLGENSKKMLTDSVLSDLTFVFANGNSLQCHAIMLLARCPSLLPLLLQPDSSKQKLSRSDEYDDLILQQACMEYNDNAVDPRTQYSIDKAVKRGDPVKVQASARLSYEATKYILEFIYAGVVQLNAKNLTEVKLLAKRCRLKTLSGLLNGETPTWGAAIPQFSLASLLGDLGYQLVDIVLQADTCISEQGAEKCKLCKLTSDHVHAHRLVLSSQCEFFEALFRSGMRDSAEQAIQVHRRKEVVVKVVYYLYCGKLLSLSEVDGDCAWSHLGTQKQLTYLQQLVELAELAEEWLLEDLQQRCFERIMHYVRLNLYLCPEVMSHAATSGQGFIVDELAEIIAPMYTQMQNSGAFDTLEEELKEIVRTAHVRMSLAAF
ncbi:hypothetical protein O6H91_10G057900 [Diphasiastrum complanatum]|nr:hypothetical protein O6H91_10G057900 [Diphasiastrum complanatum]